jgi:hypothetical protein
MPGSVTASCEGILIRYCPTAVTGRIVGAQSCWGYETDMGGSFSGR